MASLFDTLQANAFRSGITARTKDSKKWFQSKIADMTMPSRQKLLKDPALERTNRDVVGNMYMYFYDPKHKKTLPYYDRFPLTIMVQPAEGGFHGLNLHYLPYNTRAAFLDELMDLAPTKINNNTRLRKLKYELLQGTKKYKEFKPCFKHYLTKHIKTTLTKVPITEWEIAIFLPVEQFKKQSAEAVWKDSRIIARK